MHEKLIALALAALLAIGTGGVAAAGASPDATRAAQLPDDYTVDVSDPHDRLSADEVDRAIRTAVAADRVQRHVTKTDEVHVRVVAGPEQVEVQVAPGPDAAEQIVAQIGPDGTVTDVFEPTFTSEDASNRTVTVSGTETAVADETPSSVPSRTFHVDSDASVTVVDGEPITREGDESLLTLGLESIERLVVDGNLLFEVTTAE